MAVYWFCMQPGWRKNVIKQGLIGAALLLFSCFTFADVLLIEEVRAIRNMDLPENGYTKTDIESRYGAPAQKHPQVGDPPITRWDYDRFSVYFEYDLVITSVLKHGEVISQPEQRNG